jgi:catechol 2,3-dioxygenase-like lactoylglutathione lyase family enzyme
MTVIHHSAICASDIDESLRFWRDGLGFDVMMDESFEGDWPTLLHAPSRSLRSIFLGAAGGFDSGIVELVDLGLGPDRGTPLDPPQNGFLLLSIMTDVAAVLQRLSALGLGGEPRTTEVQGTTMAVVVDPDGVIVELIGTAAMGKLEMLGDEG